jgi:hypothetical protein
MPFVAAASIERQKRRAMLCVSTARQDAAC